ncbi:hypothetical protein ABEF95_003858 [Exophiala dermatitidis]
MNSPPLPPDFMPNIPTGENPRQKLNRALALSDQAIAARHETARLDHEVTERHFEAIAIVNEVTHLQERRVAHSQFTDMLTNSAFRLQHDAVTEYIAIRRLFHDTLNSYGWNVINFYMMIPDQARRLQDIGARVEQGTAAMEEVVALFDDMLTVTAIIALAPDPPAGGNTSAAPPRMQNTAGNQDGGANDQPGAQQDLPENVAEEEINANHDNDRINQATETRAEVLGTDAQSSQMPE